MKVHFSGTPKKVNGEWGTLINFGGKLNLSQEQFIARWDEAIDTEGQVNVQVQTKGGKKWTAPVVGLGEMHDTFCIVFLADTRPRQPKHNRRNAATVAAMDAQRLGSDRDMFAAGPGAYCTGLSDCMCFDCRP